MPPRSNRSSRLLVSLALLLLVGCMATEDPLPGAGTAPTSSADGEDGFSSALPPTATPTASSAPTPTPTSPPRSSAVAIAPLAPEVWLSSSEAVGAALGQPGFAQLTATVTMTDGSHHGRVDWVSLSPGIAAVDRMGVVTAVGTGEGPGPWNVTVQAIAADGKAVGVRNVVVRAEGDVAVSVE
ncbi:MAG TPA: Ig-like domain-containing protein [Pantanalinema sp.]